jgi:hypothetical protein
LLLGIGHGINKGVLAVFFVVTVIAGLIQGHLAGFVLISGAMNPKGVKAHPGAAYIDIKV